MSAASDRSRDLELIAAAARQIAAVRRGRFDAPAHPTPAPAHFRNLSLDGYDLLGEHHRGGQGVVYRALQKATGRIVAIKVLHAAAHADPATQARFTREVHILGRLRHPGIVTIHDSATSGGYLLYIMDFIPGTPLDAWVAQRRDDSTADWGVRKTLALFARLCDAVHLAHVSGIIHRDLKPGNVLVDADGRPHVLDFGLAKLAAGTADPGGPALTETGQFLGSLPWSSPEQVGNAPAGVDTRSDVYALGVMLYQALTGRPPYPVSGPVAETLRNIREREPQPPSRLGGGLDGEIDTIVLKCLHKDPARRYQTAGELQRDLERYLRGEPLEARRDSATYLVRKYLARHKLAGAIAAAFLMLVAAGLLVSTTLWQRAARDRDRAVAAEQRAARRFAEGRQLAHAFIFDFNNQLRDLPGALPARKSLVERALEYLDGVRREVGDDPELLLELAVGYRQVGNVQGNPQMSNLGDLAGAEQSYRAAIELLAPLAGHPDAQFELASLWLYLGHVRRVQGRPEDALAGYQQAYASARSAFDATGTDKHRRELVVTGGAVGDALAQLGRVDEALAAHREAQAVLADLPREGELAAIVRRDRTVNATRIGDLLAERGDDEGALRQYQESLAIDTARVADSPQSVVTRRDLSVDQIRIAETLGRLGRLDEALEYATQAIAVRTELHAADPPNVQLHRDLATAEYSLYELHLQRAGLEDADVPGELQAARAALQRTFDLFSELHARGVLRPDDLTEFERLPAVLAELDGRIGR